MSLVPPRIFSPLSNLQSSLHLCRSKSFHRHCPRRRCLTLLQCCTTCVLHCCSLLKPRAHSVSLCHATPTNAVPDGTVTFFFFWLWGPAQFWPRGRRKKQLQMHAVPCTAPACDGRVEKMGTESKKQQTKKVYCYCYFLRSILSVSFSIQRFIVYFVWKFVMISIFIVARR